jgi:hypothetical protein
MSDKWHTASFRVSSTELTLSALEDALGRPGDLGRDRGTPYRPDRSKSPVREYSLWVLKSGLDEETPLEEHIDELLLFVESKMSALSQLEQTCEFEMFCGFGSETGQGGLELSPHTVHRLAQLPINLIIALYPPG